jgi:leucyl/phenylalanyl-tRNA--protein transferase
MIKMRTGAKSHSIAETRAKPVGIGRDAVYSAFSEPRFHESSMQRLRRWVLGTAYALRPNRIALMPRLILMTLTRLFAPAESRDTLPEHPVYYGKRGLVGISNDLSVDALLANYKRGFFPVCHLGPMKWWCPEERAVIDPALTHVAKNLRRLLRQGKFKITMDQDFAGVIAACAAPRPGKAPLTWITPRVMRAYYDAHKAGYAHSVEAWDEEGRLVGGLYGLAIGKVFFGESQFSAVEHASKVALVALHRQLAAWGYHLRDGKWMTPHLASFGFGAMKRDDFKSLLDIFVEKPGKLGPWSFDADLDLADWGPQQSANETAPGRKSLKVA